MTPSEDKPIKPIQIVVALVIVLLGGGVVFAFKASKPEPARQEEDSRGLLVETQEVHADTHPVHVRAQGQVTAARRISLSPQVAGKIVWVSDDLVPGGRVEEGARLIRLDARDYRLALQSSSAEVNRAALELRLEQRRQAVAQREWETLSNESLGLSSMVEPSEEGRELALRGPQVETAEVGVEAARSAAQRARLNLQRATLEAPFNAMILEESVDVGQYVAPGSPLATLVGTDEAWVQVSVPVESIASIRLPGRDGEASPARVSFDVGGEEVVRQGRVLRLLPDLDAAGGMARILVSIPDPFAFDREGESAPNMPLLLGSYVTVDIDVPPIESAVEVPRLAVREGNVVFVMNAQSELEVRQIDVVWGGDDSVLVGEGVSDGEKVITSRVPSPVDGLKLREAGTEPSAPAEAEPSEGAEEPDR